MDIAELDRIDEAIDRLFARVAEPGDAAFRDTKHTLVMLQKRVGRHEKTDKWVRSPVTPGKYKGKGVDTHDEVPTDPSSRKRPWIDMWGDDANAQPSGGYNDEASSDEESLGSTQPTLPYPGTPYIISSRYGSTEQSESTNAIRDSLGFDITFELLDEALGEFPLVPLDALPALYLHIFGRELVPD
ncbi:hypothetical protein GGH93_004495 [Coemansia aciculifera]|nr:hypothetical protein GGH93_004495 [Coemansia aciculifera]